MAGVGNLYKAEVCFLLGLSPWTLVRDVPDPARAVALSRELLLRNKDRPEQSTTGELGARPPALGVRARPAALLPLRDADRRRRAGRRGVRAGGVLVPALPAGPVAGASARGPRPRRPRPPLRPSESGVRKVRPCQSRFRSVGAGNARTPPTARVDGVRDVRDQFVPGCCTGRVRVRVRRRRGRRGLRRGGLARRDLARDRGAAQRGADLLQPVLAGHVDRRLLHLEHAALHRVLRELGLPDRVRVAPLDLVADILQRGGAPRRRELGHLPQRVGRLLLHLRLLELAEQLGALGDLLLEHHRVALDGLLGLPGGLERLVVQGLEVFHRLLGGDQLRGVDLRGLLVALRARLVAGGPLAVGQHQRLPGRGLQLLDLTELAVQLHLQLALVADHRRGLLGQRLVLPLGILDGLLDLHLGVGVLVDLRREQRHQVLPGLRERVGHDLRLPPSATPSATGPCRRRACFVPHRGTGRGRASTERRRYRDLPWDDLRGVPEKAQHEATGGADERQAVGAVRRRSTAVASRLRPSRRRPTMPEPIRRACRSPDVKWPGGAPRSSGL